MNSDYPHWLKRMMKMKYKPHFMQEHASSASITGT